MHQKKQKPPQYVDGQQELQNLLAHIIGDGFEEFTLMCEADQRSVLTRAWRLSTQLNVTSPH